MKSKVSQISKRLFKYNIHIKLLTHIKVLHKNEPFFISYINSHRSETTLTFHLRIIVFNLSQHKKIKKKKKTQMEKLNNQTSLTVNISDQHLR